MLFFFFSLTLNAQFSVKTLYGWQVFSEEVGVVEFHPEAKPLDAPVISLHGIESLQLKFDMLTTNDENLLYSIELCNADWSPLELDAMEYMDGYEENVLYSFSTSFNTTVDYIQYRLNIPNEDVRLLKSGNYVVHIYREDTRAEILSRRFVVYEPLTEVNVMLDKFLVDEYSGMQPLSAVVVPQGIAYSDLAGYIELVVQQNGNWNISKQVKDFNVNGEGNFTLKKSYDLNFDGMNEYRFFDIKSLKFISERVEFIDYKKPFFHVYLKPDRLKGDKNYFSNVDLSGSFFIRSQESRDENMLDADYVYVHMTLASEYPIASEVYVEGALSNWQIDTNSMRYNSENASYETVLFLKQGIYNYRYLTKDFKSNMVYSDVSEGNHSQTGNDYHAYLYYHDPHEQYDRVIGYGLLKTGLEVEEHDKDADLNVIQQLLKEIAPR